MKTSTRFATVALVVLGVLGTAAGVASAQDDPAPPASATHPRRDFVCANLEQIQQVQADHATSLTDRLALLASARTAAEEAGRAQVVTRIDRRSAELTERQAKFAERQQRLADIAANCDATAD